MSVIRFAKGHGTENDFVVIPDAAGTLALTAEQVVALTDRRSGIGGDGILRVIRTEHIEGESGDAEWFMDYRNADGSIAQMCGNGVRVFARYLREEGLVDARSVAIATRGGIKIASFEDDGSITVDMGRPERLGDGSTVLSGVHLTGAAVSMGNPHLAVDLATSGLDLDSIDLTVEPSYDPGPFPDGVNQEFYADAEAPTVSDLHVRMRVYERGVGETRSCGTGVCAVAVAALARDGRDCGTVTVDVPGGRLLTDVTAQRVLLRGAAVIVARGELQV